MKLLEKLLCPHKWRTHAKKKYTWKYFESDENFTEETCEVLICDTRGKIKKIKY